MPTPLFPDIPLSYTLELTSEFRTIVTPFEGEGKEQRKRKWQFPRRKLRINIRSRDESEIRQVLSFFIARKGAFESFHIYYPVERAWYGEFVGIGDGATTTFDLGCKNTTSWTVYLDGVAQTTGVSLSSGTGENGSDQIVFSTAPGNGVLITADYTGLKRFLARFEDSLTDSLIEALIYNYQPIPIVEVKQ